jgi:hypothetical protein
MGLRNHLTGNATMQNTLGQHVVDQFVNMGVGQLDGLSGVLGGEMTASRETRDVSCRQVSSATIRASLVLTWR